MNENIDVQLSFDDLPKPSPVSSISTVRGTVACCGFYTKCSDVGHCICDSEEISSICIYKKSLDAGHIYYGKKADDFDMSAYWALVNQISGLPESTYTLLCQIADYCFRRCYLVSDFMVFEAPEYEQLKALGIISISKDRKKILSYYRVKYLRDQFEDTSTYRKEKKRSIIERAIHSEMPKLFDQLTDPYLFVHIEMDKRRYFMMAYQDGLLKLGDKPALVLPRDSVEELLAE